MYKPGLDLYNADWLSRSNHAKDGDKEITGMNLNMSAISTSVNVPVSTSIEDIQVAICEDARL